MRAPIFIIAAGLSFVACAPQEAPHELRTRAALVDHAAWRIASSQEDPFADRPAEPRCDASGVRFEEEVLEIDTGRCAYATLVQESLVDVLAGDRLDGFLWHLNLWAPESAEAHVSLRVGDEEAWTRKIPIPQPESFYDEDWIAPSDIPAGTPIWFHLHNHGSNSWRLGPLDRVPPP